jgi:hypothetical protein
MCSLNWPKGFCSENDIYNHEGQEDHEDQYYIFFFMSFMVI